jgi:outer membrane protein insertion porin family
MFWLTVILLFGQFGQPDLLLKKSFAVNLSGRPVAMSRSGQEQLIDDIEIRGNRRIPRVMMMQSIKSRPGELYRAEQGQKDLDALLALGVFDPQQTRLTTERGPRDGVIMIFAVKEYPVIRAVQYHGLKSVSEEEVTAKLKEQNIDLRTESLLIREKVDAATKILGELLRSKGIKNPRVTAEVSTLSSVSVIIIFKIEE